MTIPLLSLSLIEVVSLILSFAQPINRFKLAFIKIFFGDTNEVLSEREAKDAFLKLFAATANSCLWCVLNFIVEPVLLIWVFGHRLAPGWACFLVLVSMLARLGMAATQIDKKSLEKSYRQTMFHLHLVIVAFPKIFIWCVFISYLLSQTR